MARGRRCLVRFLNSANPASMKRPMAPESRRALAWNNWWLSTDSRRTSSSVLRLTLVDLMRMKSAGFSSGFGVEGATSSGLFCALLGGRGVSRWAVDSAHESRTEKRLVEHGACFPADPVVRMHVPLVAAVIEAPSLDLRSLRMAVVTLRSCR